MPGPRALKPTEDEPLSHLVKVNTSVHQTRSRGQSRVNFIIGPCADAIVLIDLPNRTPRQLATLHNVQKTSRNSTVRWYLQLTFELLLVVELSQTLGLRRHLYWSGTTTIQSLNPSSKTPLNWTTPNLRLGF